MLEQHALNADGFEKFLSAFQKMTPEERAAASEFAAKTLGPQSKWTAWPGPQTQAYFSPADLLLYGGAGGGGKSDLGLGLAFTAHMRSLILRRQYANLSGLLERAIEINGSNTGVNRSPPPLIRTSDGRYIQFAGNQHPGDEQDWQGIAFDLKYFDEATQFQEQMIRFHLGWLRDVNGGRVRCVLGTNPPISTQGDWIIGMFRPWLDVTHPKPAKPGELRWYVRTPDDKDMEVDGPGLYQLPGAREPMRAQSRTFIPAKMSDNPALAKTDYGARLDALPEPLRSAVRDGNFMAVRKDAEHQVIPMAWVAAAQARWRPDGYVIRDGNGEPESEISMTCIAVDPNGGGKDSAAIVARRGPWFSQIETSTGVASAGTEWSAKTVFFMRRDGCPVVVDAGGGFAGALVERLKDNKIVYLLHRGADPSTAHAKDNKLRFANKRAEAHWRFREALDPDQPGGSEIALPPDPQLAADLTTPCLDINALEQRGVIQIEPKDDIRERIGRSPDRGDAVIMAYHEGAKAVRRLVSIKTKGGLPDADLGGRVLHHQRFGAHRRRASVEETGGDSYSDEQGL